jgi:DNA-directed RNA polymerase specialized sigma24 family protein
MDGDDDRTAEFEAFCCEQWAMAVRLARLLTGAAVDADRVEALVAEAFAETYERWDGDDPEALLRRRVIAGCATTDRRGRAAPDDGDEPYAPLVRPDLLDALVGLPVRQRTAIVLRLHHGLSDQAIARAIGTADGSVDPLVTDGLTRLREATGP